MTREINESLLYIKLLKKAMYKEKLEIADIDEGMESIDPLSLDKIARNNSQSVLLKDTITEFANLTNQEYVLDVEGDEYADDVDTLLYMAGTRKRTADLLKEAEKRGFKLILIKGFMLADLYPDYRFRYSCDTDLFVNEKDKEAAIKLLQDFKYVEVKEKSNAGVTVFKLDMMMYVFTIELHTCLWEDYEGPKMKLLESMKLTEDSSLIKISTKDLEFYTLGYEQHLIFQIFHIVKHFSLQGIGLKYFVDITLYVNKYGKNISYKSLWAKLKKLGYAKFAYVIFSICHDCFGMNDDIIEDIRYEVSDEKELLIMDFINKGILFEDKTAGWQVKGMLTPYFTGIKEGNDDSSKRKISLIFPRSKDLVEKYSYAKRVPILLPIAWVHRIIVYLFKYNKNKNSWYNAKEKLEVADRRLVLMKKMDLI